MGSTSSSSSIPSKKKKKLKVKKAFAPALADVMHFERVA